MLVSFVDLDGTYGVAALYGITCETLATGFATDAEAQAHILELQGGGE